MSMRTLYHSRRVRLALAHKGLDVELRECRDDPAFAREARALAPFRTSGPSRSWSSRQRPDVLALA